MRKFFLFCLLLSSVVCGAQNIKFLGISLGTSYSSFKQNLLAKGFSYDSKESNKGEYFNCFLFEGNFAGEHAGITVMVTPKTKKVWAVSVRFREYAFSPYKSGTVTEDLQNIKYNEIRNTLCKKYTSILPYEFSSKDFPSSSTWETDNWRIDLVISWYANQWRNLDLRYLDKITEKIKIKESNDDL